MFIKLPKLGFISRKVLLLTAGTLILLLMVGTGLVQQERANRVAAHNAAVTREASIKAQNDQKAHDKAQADKLAYVISQRDAACNYLATLSTARATRGLVTVPVLACQK